MAVRTEDKQTTTFWAEREAVNDHHPALPRSRGNLSGCGSCLLFVSKAYSQT